MSISLQKVRQQMVEQSSLGGNISLKEGECFARATSVARANASRGQLTLRGRMLREGLRRGCYRTNAFGDNVI